MDLWLLSMHLCVSTVRVNGDSWHGKGSRLGDEEGHSVEAGHLPESESLLSVVDLSPDLISHTFRISFHSKKKKKEY